MFAKNKQENHFKDREACACEPSLFFFEQAIWIDTGVNFQLLPQLTQNTYYQTNGRLRINRVV